MEKKWLQIFFFDAIMYVAQASTQTTTVNTEYGEVIGHLRFGDHDTPYFSFLGVPYSKQPTGDLRFKPLQPPEKWSTPYDANTDLPLCTQRRKIVSPEYLQNGPMSEDCLGANIHVPANRQAGELLPVLVYLFGGGYNFFSGSTEVYGPEYLVAKDIVVVTVNYRIGLFGFLSLNTTDAPGNLGLKDALFFLKWIQENIEAFGGNPNEVTLAGWSSGAVMTHLLTLTPLSQGLFHRVMMQSGNALVSYLLYHPQFHQQLNSALMNAMSLSITDPIEIFQILKNGDLETLTVATNVLLDQFALFSFSPALEPQIEGNEAVLVEPPIRTMSSGKVIDVPQLIGFTTDECLFAEYRIKALNLIKRLQSNNALIVPSDIILNSDPNDAAALTETFRNRYIPDKTINDDDITGFELFCTDSSFKYPTLRYANFSAHHFKSPTYMYEFSFVGENNLFSKYAVKTERDGAGHGDDLNYFFKASFYNKTETVTPGSIEETTKDKMVAMITNFIKYGNPTPDTNQNVGVVWPPVDLENLTYLNINSELTVSTNPYPELMEFYGQFYPND